MKKIFVKIPLLLMCALLCTGAGYKGSLPDISQQFESKVPKTEVTKDLFKPFDESEGRPNYKKVPRENKAYIDIILKKDKTSPYINDLNDVILILEKMQKCIHKNDSIQKFNAIASSIIDHADYMSKKYANSPERYYISFAKLQSISQQARDIATLRCESQVYIKYLTYQGEGEMYNQKNIDKRIQDFSKELDNAIRIMKDSR